AQAGAAEDAQFTAVRFDKQFPRLDAGQRGGGAGLDGVHAASCFMKTIQCVCDARRPDVFPNRGLCGVKASTSRIGTCTSFHLKTRTPCVASTRKHSAKPLRKSARQSSDSFPYFAAIQLFGPARSRCGGSNATR